MLVIFREMIDDPALLRVEIASAEVFGADLLTGCRLHERRSAKKNGTLVANDHALVAHCRHIGAAGCAAAHHTGDLGNALGTHPGLVEEDPPEMIAVGEHLG